METPWAGDAMDTLKGPIISIATKVTELTFNLFIFVCFLPPALAIFMSGPADEDRAVEEGELGVCPADGGRRGGAAASRVEDPAGRNKSEGALKADPRQVTNTPAHSVVCWPVFEKNVFQENSVRRER